MVGVSSRHIMRSSALLLVICLVAVTSATRGSTSKAANAAPNDDSGSKRATWLVSRAARNGHALPHHDQRGQDSEHSNRMKTARASWLPTKRQQHYITTHETFNHLPPKGSTDVRTIKRYQYMKQQHRPQRLVPSGMNPQQFRADRASWLPMKRTREGNLEGVTNNEQQQLSSNLDAGAAAAAGETDSSGEIREPLHDTATKPLHALVKTRTKRDTFGTASAYNKDAQYGIEQNTENRVSSDDTDDDSDAFINLHKMKSPTETQLGHYVNGRSSEFHAKINKIRSLLTKSQNDHTGSNALSNKQTYALKLQDLTAAPMKRATWLKASKRMPTRESTSSGSSSRRPLVAHYGVPPYAEPEVDGFEKRMPTRDFLPDKYDRQWMSRYQRMFLPPADSRYYSYQRSRRMPTRENHYYPEGDYYDDDDDVSRLVRMPTRELDLDDDDESFVRMPTRSYGAEKRMPTRAMDARMPTRVARAMWLPVRDLYTGSSTQNG